GRVPASVSRVDPECLRLRLQAVGTADVALHTPGACVARYVVVEQLGRAVRVVSRHLHDSEEDVVTKPAARGGVARYEVLTTGQRHVRGVEDPGREMPGLLRRAGARSRDGQASSAGESPDDRVSPAGKAAMVALPVVRGVVRNVGWKPGGYDDVRHTRLLS